MSVSRSRPTLDAHAVLVIGLGRFGTAVASTLAEQGWEVLAVDQSVELVQKAADVLTRPAPAASSPVAVPALTRRHRGLAVAAGAVTVVAATTSMSFAAQQALPGQALYPVKRVLEDAQVSMASGAARTDGLIDHAGTRLDVEGFVAAHGSRLRGIRNLLRATAAELGATLLVVTHDPLVAGALDEQLHLARTGAAPEDRA